MKIIFLGSGRVATQLSQCFKRLGHNIVQVYSRTLENAVKLAKSIDAEAIDDFNMLRADADLIILAVSDQAIEIVVQKITPYLQGTMLVHTSGSTSLKVLTDYYAYSGVLYPLQTFSFERKVEWSQVPCLVEASNEVVLQQLKKLAEQISRHVYCYSSEQRLSLHLAGVFACNFSNACYDIAHQIVQSEQVDYALLHPLILETAMKATQFPPKDVQTGPAKRDDDPILALHEKMLDHQKRWQQIYKLMSEQIQQRK